MQESSESNSENDLESNNKKWFQSKETQLTLKLLFVGFLILLMLIPLAFVKGVIRERKDYREEAYKSIVNSWGEAQLISPPILAVPFKTQIKQDKKLVTKTSYAHFSPDNLEIEAKLLPETRYKGIFKKVVYQSAVSIKGKFPKKLDLNSISPEKVNPQNIIWKDTVINLEISDLRGIQSRPKIKLGKKSFSFEPSTVNTNRSGINAPVGSHILENRDFEVNLKIKGSDKLEFMPVAKENEVNITSSWSDPSFIGNFLPTSKKISNEGFQATWNISYLARNYPQAWIYENFSYNSKLNSRFGASLLVSVDFYRNTLRAAKYGILFVSLTFLVYLLFEIIAKLRIHPFQYTLVGLALSLFYLLLLSLSEFMGFYFSYFLASVASITLISLYTKSIVKNSKPVLFWFIFGTLIFLYSFLFVLLQLRDISLLFGSVGLFIVLTGIMFLTRDINWHEEK